MKSTLSVHSMQSFHKSIVSIDQNRPSTVQPIVANSPTKLECLLGLARARARARLEARVNSSSGMRWQLKWTHAGNPDKDVPPVKGDDGLKMQLQLFDSHRYRCSYRYSLRYTLRYRYSCNMYNKVGADSDSDADDVKIKCEMENRWLKRTKIARASIQKCA